MFAETNVAKNILEKRYYRGDEKEPQELLFRVANFIATAEEVDRREGWAREFYAIMNTGKFLPNSPCLVNSGYGGGLFACFVIGVEDNLESISKAKATAMAITKAGGGWGIGLSNLRAEGSPVNGSTHGIAGGPVGFWKTFSYDMQTMTQGGFRDAACMATLDAGHLDIKKFIGAKSPVNSVVELLNLKRITDAPEGVAITLLKDKAIAAASETYLSNFNMSVLISDEFMASTKVSEKSRDILVSIAEGAWRNGEPGVLFIDRIRKRTRYDPSLIQATNPCGEQPLPPNGSCCLGSINLSEFVTDGKFDIDMFGTVIGVAVRFLDNMITLNEFPTKETEEWSLANRSIGLGIMGYADALIKLGIGYDSKEAREFAETIAGTLRGTAEYVSKKLCDEKGPGTIGDFDGRRNNALLSIAPTGTISLLAGCSAGIEPIFSEVVERNDRTGSYIIRHKLHEADAFVTLSDIHWSAIVDTVAAFSKFIDTSISYTVNLPNSASISDALDVITYAYESGCNGCTIYRDGSRSMQVLSSDDYIPSDKKADVLKRPATLSGDTFKFVGNIDGESTNLYVTINSLDGRPWEVFVNTPYIRSLKELQLVTAVTRLSSLSLRVGAPIEKIIEQLRKIEGQSVTSIPALIAKALSQYAEADCPECGEKLAYQGGCATCVSCGYSQCG